MLLFLLLIRILCSRYNAWVHVIVIELVGRSVLPVCSGADNIPLMGLVGGFNRCFCLVVPLPRGVLPLAQLKRITVAVQHKRGVNMVAVVFMVGSQNNKARLKVTDN